MSDKKLMPLCATSDVGPGCALRAEKHGDTYAVYNVAGAYYVTQDECTHGPGYLSEGYIDGEEIECPFHQGRFHIPTGRAACPPVTEPIKCWKVHVADGTVYIDPEEHESS